MWNIRSVPVSVPRCTADLAAGAASVRVDSLQSTCPSARPVTATVAPDGSVSAFFSR